MERSRTIGTLLMAVSAFQMLVFALGVLRRSYLAVALPTLAAVGAVCGLLFWVGYTMTKMEPELAELDVEEEAELQAASA